MTANLSKLNEFMKNGNYAKAEFYLYEFLKDKPNDYTLNKNLGMTLLAQKKYDGALKSFEKCYFINKEDFDIILNLSFLFLKVQDHEQSIKFAEEALTIDAKASGAFQNLATCHLEMKDFDKAKHFAEKVIELRGGVTSKVFLQYEDFINTFADILLAKQEDENFCRFAEQILGEKIFNGDLFLKLFKHDKSKIKQDYVDVILSIVKNPENFENSLERNAQLAAANICLAEYNSKINKNLSEKQFLDANNHIVLMQRSPIYARQKMYVNLTEYF